MVRSFSTFVLIAGISAASFAGCKGKEVAHSGESPLYPLRGEHVAVACAACHGPGTPGAISSACIDCHEADRPGSDHYAGQDCVSCHTEYGWWDVDTLVTPTGTTGDTGTTEPTPTGFDHSGLPETQLCWDCHEEDRKDANHYADAAQDPAFWWDCSGCHFPAPGWLTDVNVHPVRLPHGSTTDPCDAPTPENTWLTGCLGCHPTPGSYTTYVCFGACHVGVHDGSYSEDICTTCHVNAEAESCDF